MVLAHDSAKHNCPGMPYFKEKEPSWSHWDTDKAKRVSGELDLGSDWSQDHATKQPAPPKHAQHPKDTAGALQLGAAAGPSGSPRATRWCCQPGQRRN